MVKVVLILCASALCLQIAFGQQFIGNGAYVSGNSVVDNDIFVGGGYSGGFGYGSGLGISSGFGAASGLGLGVASGLGAASGFGAASGLGSVSVAAPVGISSATLAGIGNYNVISGGPLAVTTISPIGPSGLAVASENALEGILTVNGQLPFLSAVAFEGALPTGGSGVATCGCGNGQVGITGEGLPAGLNGRPGYGNIGIGPNAGGIYF